MFWWLLRYLPEKKEGPEAKAERVLFELNVDDDTLTDVANSPKHTIDFILETIEDLEKLKHSYWERGMKRMRNVVVKTIGMLERELEEILANQKTVKEFLKPLLKPDDPRKLEGLEVRRLGFSKGDASIILRVVDGAEYASVRTLNRFSLNDSDTDLEDLEIVFRQSRKNYAKLMQEASFLQDKPRICRTIADFLYFRLIPIEVYLPNGEAIAFQPPHFPVTWAITRVIDEHIPNWDKRYFVNRENEFKGLYLSSSPHLATVNDFYMQAMSRGDPKFIFRISEGSRPSPYIKENVSPLKASSPEVWNNVFPYFGKEEQRFFALNKSVMLNCTIPDAGLERLVDRYIARNFDKFPFKALYVSSTGISKYRNLVIRIQGRNGTFKKTLEMLQRGHAWMGDRKLSACQYAVQSNKIEIFHPKNPPPLVSQCLKDPSILDEVVSLYPETTGLSIESMKERKIWPKIIANMTGEETEEEDFHLQSDKMKSMFEIYAYYGLNYIGAPIRSKNQLPLGVICLLHDNDHEQCDLWEAKSDIVALAKEIELFFQDINPHQIFE